ncbi:hypothetical protein TURU_168819 [Turdus rufiventris]|nr:hypothetical protein TURU_168819 [Turdus rufiventris]
MCTGKCSKCIGITLFPLAVCAIVSNILLYFPNGQVLQLSEITDLVWFFHGILGAGILLHLIITIEKGDMNWKFPIDCHDILIRRITESLRLETYSKFMKSTHQMNTSMPTKPYQKVADGQVVELPKSIWKTGSMLLSVILSVLGFAGGAYCVVISSLGLIRGPLCDTGDGEYLYPFRNDTLEDNYLFNQTTWSICKQPENIILWNIVLFSILLVIGVIEAILCFIQVINGLTGFICGTCMRRRKDVRVQTNANGKINGITEKGRVKLSNLNHHEEVSSRRPSQTLKVCITPIVSLKSPNTTLLSYHFPITVLSTIMQFLSLINATGIWASWKSRKNQQNRNPTEMAMVGGRNINVFIGLFTATATWVGGAYINSTAEIVYLPSKGLLWVQAPVGFALSLVIGGFFFVNPMRSKNYMTVMDPLQESYGNMMGTLLFIPPLLGEVFWFAAILASLGATMRVILDIGGALAITISACTVILYTLLGGLYSVAYTDVIQMVFITLSLASPVHFFGTSF